jgi:predicted ATPase
VCIRELRRELGDDPTAPRYIETLPRRGYRFMVDIALSRRGDAARRALAPVSRQTGSGVRAFGRAAELECLRDWLGRALDRRRQIVFLTGEAGAGKTTLVEAFIEEAQGLPDLLITRGHCIEPYGAGEAYLPFLEALGELCRGPHGNEVVALLARRAPTWLVQMPWLVSPSELSSLDRRVASATRERMLRELAEALEVLTAERPLLLVLEDLHWSDPSTRALIAWLARRREPARLLVVGTYRPTESGPTQSTMHAVTLTLQLRGQSEELPLKLLTEAAVADYVAARLPAAPVSSELPRLLHHRTDGNPLFMVNMLDDWLAHGWVAEVGGEWTLRADQATLAAGVPENLRQMVERWLDRLDPDEQRVLEIASVAGVEFSAATVAAGLGEALGLVEERCASAGRKGQLMRAIGEETWPDGTVAGRYAFVHTLYRDVLYGQVTPVARAAVHQRIAVRHEAAYGARAGEIASSLATHFERGQDYRKAVTYLRLAAEAAVRRYASVEAIDALSRALSLLGTFPDGPERSHLELGVLTALGPALTAVKGYGAPEVELIYARARTLCEPLGDTSELFPVLRGLLTLQQHRGHLRTARQLAGDLLRLSQRAQDPELLLQAHQARGTTSFYFGDHAAATRDLDWCIAHHDPTEHRSRAGRAGICTTVVCQGHLAWALWQRGYPDQALAASRAALDLARELDHPQSVALALYSMGSLQQALGRPADVQECAGLLIKLAAEHGFTFWRIYGNVLLGWAQAMEGQGEEGRSLIRQNLARLRATGGELPRTYFLGLLAEACAKAGRAEAALDVLAEALVAAESRAERFWEPDLHRLRGEVLWRRGRRREGDARRKAAAEAEKSLRRAISLARRLRAKSFELRATVRLASLWRSLGRDRAAHRVLTSVYGWFTEGLDTTDLRAARAVLTKLDAQR